MKSRKKFHLNNDIINYLKYIALEFITGTIFEFYGIVTDGNHAHFFSYAEKKYFSSRVSKKYHNKKIFKKCEGCDSNARIPTKMGPKPIAFDLAGQPSHSCSILFNRNKKRKNYIFVRELNAPTGIRTRVLGLEGPSHSR